MNRSPPEPLPLAGSERRWRGQGRVLVVDDEEAVRTTAAAMITHFGFEVEQVDSGARALAVLHDSDRPFDLVLLDLTMPGMDGFATFTAIRQWRPDQPVVVFSGYSAQDAKARFAGQHLNGFLQKPFSIDTLRETVRPFSRK